MIGTTALALGLTSCNEFVSVLNQVSPLLTQKSTSSATSNLTNLEVIAGLKQALSIGANNSTNLLSVKNGFYKNLDVKIPFPPEVSKVENKLRSIGLDKPIDSFVLTLNRAAESATQQAAPIFLAAIKDMSIKDGFAILAGGDEAATNYLKSKTSKQLTKQFSPIVARAINQAEVTKYWAPVMNTYNQFSFSSKTINPDLEAYVTNKAIDGVFLMLAGEEKKIRENPLARTSDLLEKVFGSL